MQMQQLFPLLPFVTEKQKANYTLDVDVSGEKLADCL
jgi:hypothetical protein